MNKRFHRVEFLFLFLASFFALLNIFGWMAKSSSIVLFYSQSPMQISNSVFILLACLSVVIEPAKFKLSVSIFSLTMLLYEIVASTGALRSTSSLLLGADLFFVESSETPGILSPQSIFMHCGISLSIMLHAFFESRKQANVGEAMVILFLFSLLISLPICSFFYRVVGLGNALDFAEYTRFGLYSEICLTFVCIAQLFRAIREFNLFLDEGILLISSAFIVGFASVTRVPYLLGASYVGDAQFWFDLFSIISVSITFATLSYFFVKINLERNRQLELQSQIIFRDMERDILISSIGHDIVPGLNLLGKLFEGHDLKGWVVGGNIILNFELYKEISARLKLLYNVGRNILDYVKVRQLQPVKMQHLPCNIRDVIRRVQDQIYSNVGVKPEIILDASFSKVSLPEWLVYVVFSNLIGNAFKHGSCENIASPIRVSVGSLDDINIFIRVDDSGLGFPEEDLQEALKPRVRLSTKTQGSGMGLAIVKAAVDLFSGDISVSAISDGEYKFRVEVILPLSNGNLARLY